MSELRQYILSVTFTAIIGSVLIDLSDKTSFQKQLRIVCGLFLLVSLLRPLIGLHYVNFLEASPVFQRNADSITSQGQEIYVAAMADIIKQEAEAYILKEAKSMGAELEVQIHLDSQITPLPSAAVLSGTFDSNIESFLGELLSEEFGIPKEKQTWVRRESYSSENP